MRFRKSVKHYKASQQSWNGSNKCARIGATYEHSSHERSEARDKTTQRENNGTTANQLGVGSTSFRQGEQRIWEPVENVTLQSLTTLRSVSHLKVGVHLGLPEAVREFLRKSCYRPALKKKGVIQEVAGDPELGVSKKGGKKRFRIQARMTETT